jgi:protein-tyrosine phosphatase
MPLTEKDGDRVTEDHGEQVIVTPLDESKTKFNFGPASSRDNTVYTCERPGGDPPEPGAKLVPSKVLPGWIDYIQKKNGVTNVIILLAEDELLAVYEEEGLIAAYQAAGMTVHGIPYKSENSASNIYKVLENVMAKEEKVVAHCTHGMGRSGRVAALWLTQHYGLSPEVAIDEALEAARQGGVERMGAPRQLKEWIETMKPK